MARANNNKRKTSGRGRGNQTNQPFSRRNKHQRSNHNKRQTGGWPPDSQEPASNHDVDSNRSSEPGQEVKPFQAGERTFDILVDSVPYMVKAIPFKFNGEIRYNVSFNGSPEHVFTWDSSLGQLRAIDDDSSTMPDNLEMAISEKLQSIK